MINEDRRKNHRVKINRTIHIEALNGHMDQNAQLVEMETLSPHGMSVRSKSPLLSGAHEFTVRIALPNRGTMVEATVDKIWEISKNQTGELQYGFVFSDLR